MGHIGIREIEFYETKQCRLHCLYVSESHEVSGQRLLVNHFPHIEHLLITLP